MRLHAAEINATYNSPPHLQGIPQARPYPCLIKKAIGTVTVTLSIFYYDRLSCKQDSFQEAPLQGVGLPLLKDIDSVGYRGHKGNGMVIPLYGDRDADPVKGHYLF